MRKFLSTISAVLIFGFFAMLNLYAQTPGAMTYQAEVRDSKGEVLKKTDFDLTINIFEGSAETNPILTYDYPITTDKYGLFTVIIGDPEDPNDPLHSLSWELNPYFMGVQVTDDKNNTYDLGTSQMLSVPYSIHAETAANAFVAQEVGWENLKNIPSGFADNTDDVVDIDADPDNELQNLEFNVETGVLKIAQGNQVDLNSLSTDITLADIQQMYNELANLIQSNHDEVMAAVGGMDVESLIRRWTLGEGSVTDLYMYGVLVGKLKQLGATDDELAEAGLAGTVTDIDDNTYKWVKIGVDNWMAENLKTIHFRDGSEISNDTRGTEEDGWYWEHEQLSNTLGMYYNYHVALDSRGLCPEGWHVPSTADFLNMLDFIGRSDWDLKLRERGTAHWEVDPGATNETGFLALGAGSYDNVGGYHGTNLWGRWLLSNGGSYVLVNRIMFDEIRRDYRIDDPDDDYYLGQSVRCVQDR